MALLWFAVTLPVHAAPDRAEQQARAHFAKGLKAYDVGQFDEALAEYTEAYKSKPLPGFLFNLAQCHRQLGNFERAAFFYGRYLDLERHPKNETTAKELLAEMREKQAAKVREDARLKELELARLGAAQQDPSAPPLVPSSAGSGPGTSGSGSSGPDGRSTSANGELGSSGRTASASGGPGSSGRMGSPGVSAPPEAVAPAATEVAAAPSGGITQKWWFWTGVGVLAAGAVGTAAVLVTRPHARPTTLSEINAR
jgi:hypothetical protein